MNPEDKMSVLFNNVYVPAFMHKLASAGIGINDATELDAAVKIAAAIKAKASERNAAPAAILKQAAATMFGNNTTEVSNPVLTAVLRDPAVRQALA